MSSSSGQQAPLRYRHPQSPPHGFDDDPLTRRLLRARPPRRALTWAGFVLGGTVVSARSLRGGTSSAVHLLCVVSRTGEPRRAVLRRYVRPELNLEEPGIVGHEAQALRIAEAAPLPTPTLFDADPAGSEAGVPALLMSWLPGSVDWRPQDPERWLYRVAELLPALHGTRVPAPDALPQFSTYAQESDEPPAWSRRRKLWERSVEVAYGPQPDLPHVFVHRDFHPGNVLWRRRAVSGVVDWQVACLGPAVVDVGHCRANLFSYGLDVADRFKLDWQGLTGMSYHPWADVVSVIGFLDGLRDEPGSDSLVTEEALARAMAALGEHW